jgi:hypothetical protein
MQATCCPIYAKLFDCPSSLGHPAVLEALLRLFIVAPPVPLSLKIFTYMPTDTRSMLKIVRTAAGGACKVVICMPSSGAAWMAEQVLEPHLDLGLPYMTITHRRGSPISVPTLSVAAPPQSYKQHPCARAASVLWLPYQAYTLLLRPARPSSAGDGSGGTAAAPSGSPLGDAALLLLLVLLFHAPPLVRHLGWLQSLLFEAFQQVSGVMAVAPIGIVSACKAWGTGREGGLGTDLFPVFLCRHVQDATFGNPYRSALQRLQDVDELGGPPGSALGLSTAHRDISELVHF